MASPRISFRVSDANLARLGAPAPAWGVTVSEVVRTLLEERLATAEAAARPAAAPAWTPLPEGSPAATARGWTPLPAPLRP